MGTYELARNELDATLSYLDRSGQLGAAAVDAMQERVLTATDADMGVVAAEVLAFANVLCAQLLDAGDVAGWDFAAALTKEIGVICELAGLLPV